MLGVVVGLVLPALHPAHPEHRHAGDLAAAENVVLVHDSRDDADGVSGHSHLHRDVAESRSSHSPPSPASPPSNDHDHDTCDLCITFSLLQRAAPLLEPALLQVSQASLTPQLFFASDVFPREVAIDQSRPRGPPTECA